MPEKDNTRSGLEKFVDTTKHVLPIIVFVIGLWQVDDRNAEKRGEQNEVISNLRSAQSKTELEVVTLRERVRANENGLTKVQTDVQHIKENTDKTLELVTAYFNRNRN